MFFSRSFLNPEIRYSFSEIKIIYIIKIYKYLRTIIKAYKNLIIIFINYIIINYLDNFLTIYLDDILIFSKILEEYKEHVKKVL